MALMVFGQSERAQWECEFGSSLANGRELAWAARTFQSEFAAPLNLIGKLMPFVSPRGMCPRLALRARRLAYMRQPKTIWRSASRPDCIAIRERVFKALAGACVCPFFANAPSASGIKFPSADRLKGGVPTYNFHELTHTRLTV